MNHHIAVKVQDRPTIISIVRLKKIARLPATA